MRFHVTLILQQKSTTPTIKNCFNQSSHTRIKQNEGIKCMSIPHAGPQHNKRKFWPHKPYTQKNKVDYSNHREWPNIMEKRQKY